MKNISDTLSDIMAHPKDPEARRIALDLLKRGEITPGEAAEITGFHRDTVYGWLTEASIDWKRAREAHLTAEWRRAVKPGRKKPTKKQLRARADDAVKSFRRRRK